MKPRNVLLLSLKMRHTRLFKYDRAVIAAGITAGMVKPLIENDPVFDTSVFHPAVLIAVYT